MSLRAFNPVYVTMETSVPMKKRHFGTAAAFCAIGILAGCSHHADSSPATSSAATSSAHSTATTSSEWDQAAARQFAQKDAGAKQPFICDVRLNTSSYMDETVSHYGGASSQVPTTITGDPAIGFDLLGTSELRVSATSPRQALALIGVAGRHLIVAMGCYSDATKQPRPTTVDATAVDGAYQANQAAYLWAQYTLLSQDKAHDKAIAQAISPAYAAQTDVFKRQDMYKQLQPTITQLLATAKAKPYVDEFASVAFGHYDQKTNSFAVSTGSLQFSPSMSFAATGQGWTGSIALSLDGSPALLAPHPANMQVARAFEAYVSHVDPMLVDLQIKCVGVGASGGIPTVEGWLVRYDISDSTGHLKFTVGPHGTLRTA